MHSAESTFPGIDANGGYAELLKTSERAVVKLQTTLSPKDVAPYADAGLTAYRAAKKASRHLLPRQFAVVIGAGGSGHIAIQVLRALSAATIIVVDRSPAALELAKQLGSDYNIMADSTALEEIRALTHGKGPEAVIDFVGEGSTISEGFAMTRNAGYYYAVGYGGELRIPTMDLITTEKTIVGNLVGTYPELVELIGSSRSWPGSPYDAGIQACGCKSSIAGFKGSKSKGARRADSVNWIIRAFMHAATANDYLRSWEMAFTSPPTTISQLILLGRQPTSASLMYLERCQFCL